MSLKNFHIIFITLAVLCTFGFAAWATLVPWVDAGIRGLGLFSAVLGVFLMGYGAWFWKKSRALIT
jgi:hypothetical protein